MFLVDICKLSKTPGVATCLENHQEVFVMLIVFLSSLEVFTFPGYFSMPLAFHPGFSGPWRPLPALSSTLATFGCITLARLFRHIVTTSATVLSGQFLPTADFYLALLPHMLAHFVTQIQEGTLHPGYSSVPALKELSLPADAWPWTTHIVDIRLLVHRFTPASHEV